jgi:predicted metal-dependent phosphotriesterase family hydrolase
LVFRGAGAFATFRAIKRVAEATPVSIIVATGMYTYNDIPFYFHYRSPALFWRCPELMVEMFVRDIRQNMADTDSKLSFPFGHRCGLHHYLSGVC